MTMILNYTGTLTTIPYIGLVEIALKKRILNYIRTHVLYTIVLNAYNLSGYTHEPSRKKQNNYKRKNERHFSKYQFLNAYTDQ